MRTRPAKNSPPSFFLREVVTDPPDLLELDDEEEDLALSSSGLCKDLTDSY